MSTGIETDGIAKQIELLKKKKKFDENKKLKIDKE